MSARWGTEFLFKAFNTLEPADFKKRDVLVGIAFAAGGIWIGISYPDVLRSVLPVAAGLVGVVVGAVIGGIAVGSAFLDEGFLRKLKRIDAEPVRYFLPLFFTAVLGVTASLLLLFLVGLPRTSPTWVRATAGGFGGLFTGWAIASLIYGLDALVGFIQLKDAAADVPDEPGDAGTSHIKGVTG